MSDATVTGRLLDLHDEDGGARTPFYVLPFDAAGRCTAPATRDRLLQDAAGREHLYVGAHGWNDPAPAAIDRYRALGLAVRRLRGPRPVAPAADGEALFVGVTWPSTVLVAPWERGPDVAAGGAVDPDLAAITAGLPPADAAQVRALLGGPVLSLDDARRVARLLAAGLAPGTDELDPAPVDPDALVAAWSAVPAGAVLGGTTARTATTAAGGSLLDEDGADGPDGAAAPAGDGPDPRAAGLLDALDPRTIIRLTTVLLMKDRAGTVGRAGVGDLLRDLRSATQGARIHLVGHSYGCKVVLSALCGPPDGAAVRVRSVLLLQPAVSCYCFAPAGGVPGRAGAGGYHRAPDRSELPVLSTFSARDVPLTRFFHWAARRDDDLGEVGVAALPPSRYAALGGFGPQGVAATVRDAVLPRAPYDLPAGPGIVGLRCDGVIGGHGDVVNDATAWMLLAQAGSA